MRKHFIEFSRRGGHGLYTYTCLSLRGEPAQIKLEKRQMKKEEEEEEEEEDGGRLEVRFVKAWPEEGDRPDVW